MDNFDNMEQDSPPSSRLLENIADLIIDLASSSLFQDITNFLPGFTLARIRQIDPTDSTDAYRTD